MSRVAKRSAAEATNTGPRKRNAAVSPPPRWIPPKLCQPVETAPSGPQWLHEIKLDGFRMAARIDRGRVQLLTRTGLDWSEKYPNVIAALANVRSEIQARFTQEGREVVEEQRESDAFALFLDKDDFRVPPCSRTAIPARSPRSPRPRAQAPRKAPDP